VKPEVFPREFFAAMQQLQGRINSPFFGNKNSSTIGRTRRGFEHRQYQVGDDPRQLDWKASARTGRNLIRLRELDHGGCLQIILDRSASLCVNGLARDYAQRRLALAFAWLQSDAGGSVRIGQLGAHSSTIMDKLGCRDYLNNLAACKGECKSPAIPKCERTIIISDPWLDVPAHLPTQVEVVCLIDEQEERVPTGRLNLRCAETGKVLEVNASRRELSTRWTSHLRQQSSTLRKLGASWHELRGWRQAGDCTAILASAKELLLV